ncbi:MAG: PilZ domain-containing protein [Spirochaetales bacterium]|nr:PilZ domain-containing protein [Spirochaetales bacterium]
MRERREARRVDVNTAVDLSVEGMVVRGEMVNLSDDGALFRIGETDAGKVSTTDLGKQATFVLKLKSTPDREYTGEIIRFFYKDDDKHIALRFWRKYRELPEG